jgi:hypothetical protein
MQVDPQATQTALSAIRNEVARPFYLRADFWISSAISLTGLYFSVRAFLEASRASRAAVAAGRNVKIQTATVELTEIVHKLDRIQPGIKFREARDILTEISWRFRRTTAPFGNEQRLKDSIQAVIDVVKSAQELLKGVKPESPAGETEAPDSVYFAIESACTTVGEKVADLTGLFERESQDWGGDGDA